MKVLVAYGSKRGGTAGIAEMVASAMRHLGADVEVAEAGRVRTVSGFDAVVIGGSLYAGHWSRSAQRLVKRHASDLETVPVWMFSSGPLDDTALDSEIPPVAHVAELIERVGARGHATFGGRLLPDATGFPASAMAKTMSGDWRDPDRIFTWAERIVRDISSQPS
jgi:menaquinone-dependent protoporphyrinogen oxidase